MFLLETKSSKTVNFLGNGINKNHSFKEWFLFWILIEIIWNK